VNTLAGRAIVPGVTGWHGDGGNQDGNQGAWGAEPYGQDPYYLQPEPPGHPGYPPPPPPDRSRLPMIFGVLAIALIVGAVVTIVLVNREAGTPTAQPTSTAPPTPVPTRSGQPSPTTEPSGSTGPDARNGWQTIDNSAESGLIYEVPPDWKVVSSTRPSGLGVDFTGTADFGSYQCERNGYVRSYATSGDVQAKDGKDLDLAKTVKDFAGSFATVAFKDTATVSVPEPQEYEIDGQRAMRLTAKVTPQAAVPACDATEGEIAIVGVLLEEDGKSAGVAMLVVVSDVAGGPAEPKSLPTSVAQEVLASIRVG